MFDVHVIESHHRAEYGDVLDEYFHIRHEIYVGERGWLDLSRPDKREIDSFDTDSAVYLIGLTPDRRVAGGSRLVPTLQPHLMSDVFPGLAGAGLRRSREIFEWSRIFVIPTFRTSGRPCRAAGIMYCALVEYCLKAGVRNLSVVCEEYWFDRLASLGWNPQRLGEPLANEGNAIVGLLLDMTEAALATTRRIYGISGSVLAPQKMRGSPGGESSLKNSTPSSWT